MPTQRLDIPETRPAAADAGGSDRRHRGPGLFESCAWTAGYQVAQVLVFAALGAVLLWAASPVFPPTFEQVVRIVDDLGWGNSFLFTGVTTLASLFVIVPVVQWRLGGSLRGALGLRRLNPAEALLLVAAVVPLGLLSDEVYRWGLRATESLATVWPWLRSFTQIDAMQLIQHQSATTTYPIVLVAVGLGPAIGEELIFRGLIGRGLISRYGVWTGIAATTLLFALAHGSPAHALATIPVGLFLHFAYLTTGNLWAPILLHGLLNGLAVTLMKLDLDPTQPADPAVLCAAAGYLLIVGTLLCRPRINRVEASASGTALMAGSSASPSFALVATCGIVCYTSVFVWTQVMPAVG
jgi:membrane protease YdiL (CAAX protease family)